jgi:hypothetical protein
MAYTGEANAIARLTKLQFGETELKGPLGVRIITSVRRYQIADASRLVVAISRPVAWKGLDQQIIARFLDHGGAIAYSTTGAAFTATFSTAAGGAASIVTGKVVPGTIEDEGEPVDGGFPCQQMFELEDTGITRTVSQ